MGKFFGLVACIGTLAVTSGCVKPSETKSYENRQLQQKIELEQSNREFQQTVERIKNIQTSPEFTKIINDLKSQMVCNTKEADQKISTEAEANTVAVALAANVQDTTYVNCEGKEINAGQIVDEAQSSVVVTGPSVPQVITSVEITSERTCAKLESSDVFADVTQVPDSTILAVEADGDVKIPVSTSSLKLGIAMNVAEGKNLLKLKYFNCVETKDVTNEDGTVTKVCGKSELVAEKEVVLNTTLTKQVAEGVRKIDLCKTAKAKTDAQE